MGGNSARTFTIRNTGNANLANLAVVIDGAHASDFAVTAMPTGPVPGSGSTTFVVNFSPSVTGTRSAVLHIASNDSDESPFDIDLLGSGVSALGVAQQAYLKASNTGADDQFGFSVAVSGETVVVGAPGEASNATGVNGNGGNNSAINAGAAYVFVRSGATWSQQAYLKASNPDAEDSFGHSVGVSGDTVVVGAWQEDSSAGGVNGDQGDNSVRNSGAAYVFVRSGTTWSQQAYLKASNPDTLDYFGWSVAVSGDTVIVGADSEDSNASGVNGNGLDNSTESSGAAYVFQRAGTNWFQQAYLKASNTQADDHFGWSVGLSGDTAVVGALWESSNATGVNGNGGDNSALNSGAAYVFVRNADAWSQQAYVKASNTEATDLFGYSVAVSGDTLVVGAIQEDGGTTGVSGDGSDNSAPDSGAAYVFARSGATWNQQAYLKAFNTETLDSFGYSVSVSGDTALIGAWREDSNATALNGNATDNSAQDSGAAFLFKRSETTWSGRTYVKASNTGQGDSFGYSVSVAGDLMVAGAPSEAGNGVGVNGNQNDNSAPGSGAAYVLSGLETSVTAIEAWRQAYFGSPSSTGNGADLADPDQDALPNLLEFGTEQSPIHPGAAPITVIQTGSVLEITYLRNKAAFGEFAFIVEWSDFLDGVWSTEGVKESILSDDGVVQHVSATVPQSPNGQRFVRLRVTEPPIDSSDSSFTQ